MTDTAATRIDLPKWRYEICYGPDGETDYAMVYSDTGALVGNLKTHFAMKVVSAVNKSFAAAMASPAPAQSAGAVAQGIANLIEDADGAHVIADWTAQIEAYAQRVRSQGNPESNKMITTLVEIVETQLEWVPKEHFLRKHVDALLDRARALQTGSDRPANDNTAAELEVG